MSASGGPVACVDVFSGGDTEPFDKYVKGPHSQNTLKLLCFNSVVYCHMVFYICEY